jgi:hypothetical protein
MPRLAVDRKWLWVLAVAGWLSPPGIAVAMASTSIGRSDPAGPSIAWTAVASGSLGGALLLWGVACLLRHRSGHNVTILSAGLPLLAHLDSWLIVAFQYFHEPTNHLFATGLVTSEIFTRPSVTEYLAVKYVFVTALWTTWPWISKRVETPTIPTATRSMQAGLIVAAVLGAMAYIRFTLLDVLEIHVPSDLRVNYIGALAMREGLNPYDNAVALKLAGRERIPYVGTQLWTMVTNPPTAMLYFAPFTTAPLAIARIAFLAASQIALFATTALTWRLLRPRLHPLIWLGLVLGLVAVLDPFALAFRLGQVDLVIIFALTLAAYRLRNGDDPWAGLAIGVAAGLKLSPGLLVLYLLWRGHWRALIGTIATAGIIGLASLSLAGTATWQYYLTYRLPDLLAGSSLFNNLSAPGLVLRVFMGPELAQTMLDAQPSIAVARVLTITSVLAILGVTAWAIGRRNRSGGAFVLEFSLVLVVILLISGVSWPHYLCWLLPLLGIAVSYQWPSRAGHWTIFLAALGLAIASIPIDVYHGLFGDIFDRSITLLSVRTIGLLMLLLALVESVRATPRTEDRSTTTKVS